MAVTITAERLAALVGVDATRAAELLAVATGLVTEYAPDAPDSVADEAVIRVAGYLNDRKPGIRRESVTVGDYTRSATYETANTSALRASGAMGLLSRYKIRRAGAI